MLSGIISAGQKSTVWAQGNASVRVCGMGTEKGSCVCAVPRTMPRYLLPVEMTLRLDISFLLTQEVG